MSKARVSASRGLMTEQTARFEAPPPLHIQALGGIPLVREGDDLAALILSALVANSITLHDGDVLVVSSKIVSKAEGQRVALETVTPGEEAIELAQEVRKDPRVVELILRESDMVSRKAPYVLVTQHRLGFVSANAGIDQSNIEHSDEYVLLLPLDPDASAEALRGRIARETGRDVAIVISDTHGRPFRLGNIGVAIGIAGLPALVDHRGEHDLFGRELKATVQGYGDLIASAAHLVCGEGAEGLPVVLVRGLSLPEGEGRATDLNRPPEMDLYR